MAMKMVMAAERDLGGESEDERAGSGQEEESVSKV